MGFICNRDNKLHQILYQREVNCNLISNSNSNILFTSLPVLQSEIIGSINLTYVALLMKTRLMLGFHPIRENKSFQFLIKCPLYRLLNVQAVNKSFY